MQEIKQLKVQVQQVHHLTHILQDQALQVLLHIHLIYLVFQVMQLLFQLIVELMGTVKVHKLVMIDSVEFNYIKMELLSVAMVNLVQLQTLFLLYQTAELEQEVN
jgi:hypothetical protein